MAKNIFENNRIPGEKPLTKDEIIDLIQQQIADFAGTSTYRKGVTSGVTVSGITFTALPIGWSGVGGVASKTLEVNGNAVVSGTNTGDQDLSPYLLLAGGTMTGDLKIKSDSKKLFLGGGEDMTIWYDGTNGNIKTSDVSSSDLNIITGVDKTMVLDTAVWDDLRVTAGSFDRPGTSDPVLVSYTPSGSGTSTYLYEFDKNDIATFVVQLPHSYKHGTDIGVHVHWTPGANGAAESGNKVGWKVDYSWANIEGTFAAMATADLSDACDGTNHKHQMTTSVTIDGHTASKHISSMLLCNIKRTDTGTDDTWSGTASGALPLLMEIDFHYQIDTIGSRTESSK